MASLVFVMIKEYRPVAETDKPPCSLNTVRSTGCGWRAGGEACRRIFCSLKTLGTYDVLEELSSKCRPGVWMGTSQEKVGGGRATLKDQCVLGELHVTAHLLRQRGGMFRDKLEK